MKFFCPKVLFVFIWLIAMPLAHAQAKTVEQMSVQELRQKVVELEAQTGKIKVLKEENKRLRRQLRKARMQIYDAKAMQTKDTKTELNLPKTDTPKDIPVDESNEKVESFWEWLTK